MCVNKEVTGVSEAWRTTPTPNSITNVGWCQFTNATVHLFAQYQSSVYKMNSNLHSISDVTELAVTLNDMRIPSELKRIYSLI